MKTAKIETRASKGTLLVTSDEQKAGQNSEGTKIKALFKEDYSVHP